jgi:DNA primase
LKNARDKSIAVQRLAPIIREVGDAVQRAHYTQQLARLVQVAEQTVTQEIAQQKRAAQPAKRPVEEAPVAARRPVSKREEYFLTLALRTPEHLPRVAFLDAEDFADAETRAFYRALREFGEAAELFDREAFRAALEPSLLPLLDRLSEAASNGLELTEPDLAREIEIAAYRLRAERDKAELARLEVLLRDRDEERDAEEERNLLERVNVLRKRIAQTQKALSARTALKPHTF